LSFHRKVDRKLVESPKKEVALPKHEVDPEDSFIMLERTECFGSCPIYRLTIYGDGRTLFDGKEYVKAKGLRTGKISPESLNELWRKFDQVNFFDIPDGFPVFESDCPEDWTDNPTAKVTVFHNGKFKYVSHYHGCRGTERLDQLSQLEYDIDQAANTNPWLPEPRR
jgi:hypothetical protein